MTDMDLNSTDNITRTSFTHTGGSTLKSGGDFQLAPESDVSTGILDRFMRHEDVIRFSEMYKGHFVSPEKWLVNWMNKPNLVFGGKTPQKLVKSGQDYIVMRLIQSAIK
jgi:hypothetical protein